ncbi:helix-turn-helix domain-containing protein [Halomonas sp. M4R1S46]|uniref:helix-turn-helix domain-containing protein n=1 Tax=Halomonas sp. M4R1S46 TaxID=2982692 RepID=UPI0021E4D7B1|nr:helix-turn-helix transcriptional regulator [Halomonas sp. M4R1S46]UYG07286.1 helix-turn-helix domain-containing protein [Halomonas sp. M4R1S46]
MSSEKSFSEKLKEIRDVNGLGRKAFSDETGIPIRTIEGIEQRGTIPRTDIAQKICKRWPEYSLWLMTDQVNEEAGQISPEIEKARKTLKQTGTDTD